MRVCLVSKELAPYSGWGVGTYAANMAAALARAGNQVHILTDRAPRLQAGPNDLLSGAIVHLLEEPSLSYLPGHVADRPLTILAALRALHAAHRFDLIEFHDFYADAYHVIQAKRTLAEFEDTVLAVRLHSPIFLLRELNHQHTLHMRVALVEHMEAEAIRGADCLFAPSSAILERIREHLGDPIRAPWRDVPTPAHILPNPFDPTLLASAPIDAAPRAPHPEILAFGRLEYRKGFHTLVSAAISLLDQNHDVRLRIIGANTDSWPAKRSVRAQLEDLVPSRWADRFTFQANVSRARIAHAIARADLCCFPSLWENFPYACLEAMSAARPVVASHAGGFPEIIDHARTGYLFQPGDVADLARVLAEALHDPNRADVAARAAQRVNDLTDPATIVARLHEVVSASAPAPVARRPAARPTVAVLIPHKDMPATLGAAIDSVRAQTVKPDQIILVDDGSDLDDARSLVDRLAQSPDLTVIRQPNKGLAGARNAGLRHATTDYVIPLDADDLLAPTFIERTLAAAMREPGIDMVTTLMACFEGDPASPRFGFAPIGLDHDTLPAVNAASSCTALLRRDAVLAAGAYDESLWAYEDWDLYCAMAERAMTSAIVPDHLVLNRVRSDSMLRALDLAGDHDLRAAILAKHPSLPTHPDRVARILLADRQVARARAPRAPSRQEVEAAARAHTQTILRYRLADRAVAWLDRTRLTPIIKAIFRRRT